ncbi:MAG: hypothetical protein NVV59_05385 [Chitinophagaceae bacterium]|nr:hypothetical protein [Chitinophagaceae bacterium]
MKKLMAKHLIVALGAIVCLTSCSSLQPISSSLSSPVKGSTSSNTASTTSTSASKQDVKFLDDISLETDASVVKIKPTAPVRKTSGAQSASTADVNRYLNKKMLPLKKQLPFILNMLFY